MIELAREIPLFRPISTRFVRGKPEAMLLVEFAGEDAGEQLAKPRPPRELMADLGLPDSVVEATEPAAEGHLGGAQGRPQHHDVDEGRRQAGLLHRGLRGAARGPGRLHRAPDRDLRASTAPAAPGTPTPRSAACTCARSSTSSGRGRRRRCAPSPRRPSRWCANTRAPTPASTATASCARSSTRRCSGRAWSRAFEEVKDAFDPAGLFNPGKIVRSAAHGRPHPVPLQAGLPDGSRSRPRSTGRRWGGFAGAVEMCNNNGACRKFDAGVMCPSYRVTQDEQHLTRGRANTLRLALSRPARPRRARPPTRWRRPWRSASPARAASANARPASTWRA